VDLFINMPIGLATVVLALRYVTESRLHGARRSYDLAGAAAVTGGLVVFVYAIVKAQTYGWGSARTLGLGGAALVLLAAFIAIERRSHAPLMRLSILRVRPLVVGDAALLCMFAGMFGMFFFASLYVQDILGYSPLTTGGGVPACDDRDHARLRRLPTAAQTRRRAQCGRRGQHGCRGRDARTDQAAGPQQLRSRPAGRPDPVQHRLGASPGPPDGAGHQRRRR
jgi:hypothetical protein